MDLNWTRQSTTPAPRNRSRPGGHAVPISRSSDRDVKQSGCAPCPPALKPLRLSWPSTRRTGPKQRRLAAICYAHNLAGHPSPTASEAVKATLRGIKRTFRQSPARKAPATSDKIAAMVALTGYGSRGLRDRALLLLAFAGAFRRSELVALNLEDLEFCEHGLRVTIQKSKTDQEGDGATIAIARGSFACPVNAVRDWVETARLTHGPIFRPVSKKGRILNRRLSDRAVTELVKAYARRAGLKAGDFSAHSLRAGFLISAARRGASLFRMMDVSRHKSVDTLRGYPNRWT